MLFLLILAGAGEVQKVVTKAQRGLRLSGHMVGVVAAGRA